MQSSDMSQPTPLVGIVVRGLDENTAVAVRDLSETGARLLGTVRLVQGEHVRLHLQIDGEALALAAEVVQFDQQRAEATIVFRGVSDAAKSTIARWIAQLLGRVHPTSPTVLVVHTDRQIAAALQRDIARVGLAGRVCTTLLELTWQLADCTCVAVIVGAAVDSEPILVHLEQQHPDVKRVLLFGAQVEKLEYAAAGRVHAVLRTPWRTKGLARALGAAIEGVTTTHDQLMALRLEVGDE